MKHAMITICLLAVLLLCSCDLQDQGHTESTDPVLRETISGRTSKTPSETTNGGTETASEGEKETSQEPEAQEPILWTFADPSDEKTQIRATGEEQALRLYLPSSASLKSVPLYCSEGTVELTGDNGVQLRLASGESADLTRFPGNGQTEARCAFRIGAHSGALTVFRSENLDAMFLVSDDPVNCGRSWVEASRKHTAKAKGAMTLLSPTGETVYSGALTQIKGRGNSTWTAPKRPYQIKLEKKTDLIAGNSANASKTWLLLANYMDASMMRNDLIFDVSRALGLEDTPEYAHADLWYDGEYRGSYLMTEKVEIGSGRIEIEDLEKAVENANPAYDFDAPTVKRDTTPWGTEMQYAEGIADPEDLSGGYLLEMEKKSRARKEVSWFQTRNGDYLFVNSPEVASRDALLYIAGLYQDFEDAVVNGGYHPETGMHYSEYVDLESLVRCYLAMEVSGNSECFMNSTFFYKDAGDGKLRCGPMWDYDLSLSVLSTELRAGKSRLGSALLALPDFSARVEALYRETLYPLLGSYLSEDGRIESLRKQLAASARMNYTLWAYRSYTGEAQAGDGFDENVAFVADYLSQRREFLLTAFRELVDGAEKEKP